jgi:hypothetical protein
MKTYYFIICKTKNGVEWILTMTSDYKKYEEDLKILNSTNPRIEFTVGSYDVSDDISNCIKED